MPIDPADCDDEYPTADEESEPERHLEEREDQAADGMLPEAGESLPIGYLKQWGQLTEADQSISTSDASANMSQQPELPHGSQACSTRRLIACC